MQQFTKPAKLNGNQLIKELNDAGISASTCLLDEDAFFVDVPANKKTQAETIVNSHIGVDTQPTLADKLASVGLSIDELKAALA